MKEEILIIGGGVAGISAAIHALEVGFSPVILEKNRDIGGRVRSFYAKDIQETLDNGQHILSAAYHETIKLLNKINSLNKITFQKNLEVLFIENPQKKYQFRSGPLPAPFHFFFPLIFYNNSINTSEIFKFIWKNIWINGKVLRKMTIAEWLDVCGQSQKIQSLIWKPMCLSILNANIDEGSAYLMKHAINRSFLRSKKKASLGLPNDWLGKIFGDPASKYILQRGGQIHLFNTVKKLITEENCIKSVITDKNEFKPKWIISTVPPFALGDILSKNPIPKLNNLVEIISKFTYNPIITINIFIDKPINEVFPLAIISSPLQWIFPHPDNNHKNNKNGYTMVISAANKWINRSKEELLNMVRHELKRVLHVDLDLSHRLIKYKIVKEKRATISQTPEALKLEVSSVTPINNFFLAGDWIKTGLPATIEGAILSGKNAIKAIQQRRT